MHTYMFDSFYLAAMFIFIFYSFFFMITGRERFLSRYTRNRYRHKNRLKNATFTTYLFASKPDAGLKFTGVANCKVISAVESTLLF